MRRILWVAAILWMATTIARAEESKSQTAFQQLSRLVGVWKGVQDGVDITLTYTLTAAGTALMEEFRPATGGVMVTMFTVDGDHLIATHYCPVGNQPHMVTAPITDSQHKTLVFSLDHITGMKTPDDWHNTGVEVMLEDKDHLSQKWTYMYKGKAGTSIFHFTRKQS